MQFSDKVVECIDWINESDGFDKAIHTAKGANHLLNKINTKKKCPNREMMMK